MLEKVICIDNVGVIKKGVPKSVDLQKVVLIYADNARGKSTLSSLLLACSDANVNDVVTRKTVGSTTAQKVILRFNPPSGAFNAEFDGTLWKGPKPNLHVFNQAFVERNVFASTGVLPEQREALLTLALGDAAVAERATFEQQAALQKDCAGKVTAAEGALVGFRGNHTVDQFIALAPLDDVDQQLANIDKQIGESRAADQIANRPEFKTVVVPAFNFDGLPEVVASSFESLAVKAEELAKAQFAKHNGSSTERWVSEGLEHKPDNECPFCGQETSQLELLKAYRAYFDGSYSDHLQRISFLREGVNSRLTDRQLVSWKATPEFNEGLFSVWAEGLGIQKVPPLNFDNALVALKRINAELLMLVEAKERNPLDALDPAPFANAMIELDALSAMAARYNVEITALNEMVANYKAKFAKPDLDALTIKRGQLVIRKNRYDDKSILLIDAVKITRADYKAAEMAKDAARAELDKLMAETLTKFQRSINDWLLRFATPFQIEQLAPTYKGGGLRSEYVLKVRGARVNVGPGAGGELLFHSALSEGDKRTLAFAFFLAKLFAAPNRAGATVVLDDVFTSLDKHRRHNTIEGVLKMVAECAQVIALGHDAHFLRELKKRVSRKKLGEAVELALHRDAEDYSYLDNFDLDDYCSSEYYKHYVLVERFVNAEPSTALFEVAKSLRLLVEGHLHRCFPKKFKEGQTVGEMLDLVKNATVPNSLVRLQSLLPELMSFNEFAAAFHHDTSGGFPRTEVNEAELLPFAKGALGFIQIRSFKSL
ncbi:AAA family ATPase [Janthinobacterium sp. PLB04]|uniref:AAA family ATPase n=1 Tax=Janthinobacterium lividum TaxID=29581 RepID=A0AAJ4MP95_9BURK|nr:MULTISPECIES: AAA family ATPase [Janthinobacterium]KAB0325488.1 AAA family ATPase [Janthinobacterium lividum]QSX94591.1 AAA family ATPase [Janthinobacterium lividum]UGQ34403.1 AAA family ATPase [Janthinobacterium sp. PLB04]